MTFGQISLWYLANFCYGIWPILLSGHGRLFRYLTFRMVWVKDSYYLPFSTKFLWRSIIVSGCLLALPGYRPGGGRPYRCVQADYLVEICFAPFLPE